METNLAKQNAGAFFIILSLILSMGIAAAVGNINFVSPTPANSTSTTATNAEINISITNASNLDAFVWSWNNANYTFYDKNLALMLNFDNISAIGENSSSIIDVSMHGNNISLINGTSFSCTDARYGCALSFDGIDDYAKFPDSLTIINTSISAYSLEAWFKARGLSANNYIFEAAGAGPSYFGLRTDNSTLKFLYGNDTSYTLYDSGINLSINTWYYANVVLDPGAGSNNLKIYLNGNLISQFNDTRRFDLQNTKIGSNWKGGRLWNGTIDELRLWNRSLSAAEIQQHYYSNFYKYAADKWVFYTNQQNLAVGTYLFYGYIRGADGSINQTETRTITIAGITETTSSAGKKCANECSLGERKCAGDNGYRICGDYDLDSCRDWSNTKYCADGKLCSDGACKISCNENWACDDWGACENGEKTRICRDSNNCGTSTSKPDESLDCLGRVNLSATLETEKGLLLFLTIGILIIILLIFAVLSSRKIMEKKRRRTLAYRRI